MNNKTVVACGIGIVILIFSYVIYINIFNKNLNHESDIDGKDITKEEYIYKEELLKLGYKIDEITKIETKLSNINVKNYLLNKKYDGITKYLDCSLFNIVNLERYIAFERKNKELSIDKIITYVEANLDQEFYTNINIIQNPNETTTLINKYNKLADDYVITDLVNLEKEYSTNKLAIKQIAALPLMTMIDDAKKEGINLNVISAYRTNERQKELYNSSVKKNGKKHALLYSAKPGHSEHQLGLAVDLNTTQEKFKNTKEYAWLKENAHKYGFIERYPKGKEDITGFNYEPWHYRYLGVDIATKIYNENITFEEYIVKYSK